MKRRSNVSCEWNSNLAYVLGMIATDGNLSPDGRHIAITSKDRDLAITLKRLLHLKNKIGRKARGVSDEKKYYVVQFGDINFYEFLITLGLTPAKSKTLGPLKIPKQYFSDFLRGCIDGDGTIGSFMHPESTQLQIRLRLCSASPLFLSWISDSIKELYHVTGYRYESLKKRVGILSYGKHASLKLLKIMYYSPSVPALVRKRRIAEKLLRASGQIGIGARLRTVSRKR